MRVCVCVCVCVCLLAEEMLICCFRGLLPDTAMEERRAVVGLQ